MLVAGGSPGLISVRECSGSKMAFALISNGGGEREFELEIKEGLVDGQREGKTGRSKWKNRFFMRLSAQTELLVHSSTHGISINT